MPFAGGEIDEPAVGKNADAAPILELELLDERAGLRTLHGKTRDCIEIEFVVEVPRVADDRTVLHGAEVLFANDVIVAGHGHEDVADPCGLGHRHDTVAVHHRFDRLPRVDLGDDDVRAHPRCARGNSATAPTVAHDDERVPREQDVRRANDPVERGLTRAVSVVEHVFCERVVHRNHRIRKNAVALHRLEANHAGRRLLTTADHLREQRLVLRENGRHEIAPVVHRHLRTRRDHRFDVRIIALVIFALDRERRHAVLTERGRDVILRRERIARAERGLGAPGFEREHEVCGLGCHVQACADAHAAQRLLLFEALANLRQHGHVRAGPGDARAALLGERTILDVALRRDSSLHGPCLRRKAPLPRRECTPDGVSRAARFG